MKWGSNENGFSFPTIKLQEVAGHPCLYLHQAGRLLGGCRGGVFTELSIICIAMERNVMLADNVRQEKDS